MSLRERITQLTGALGRRSGPLCVEDAMSVDPVTVRPSDTVGEAARRIVERDVAAAVVEPEGAGPPGILTARDMLEFACGERQADEASVGDHSTPAAQSIAPGAPLEQAAREMTAGGFRHLVVVDGERTAGVVSMRDLVRCWITTHATPEAMIPIRRSMSTSFLSVEPQTTVRAAARLMAEQNLGAAVVVDEALPHPGIFSERELLEALADHADLGAERVGDRVATRMSFSAPGWSLRQAAEAMTKGDFQHVVVVDLHEIRGVLAMRDIVRAWMELP